MLNPNRLSDLFSDLHSHHHNLANHLTTLHLILGLAGSPKYLSTEDFDLLNRLVDLLQVDLTVARESAFGLEETVQKAGAEQQTPVILFKREVA